MPHAKELLKNQDYIKNMIKRARSGDFKLESEEKFIGTVIPNATQVPNEIFDYWLPNLKESEIKVLLYIVRKTFGYSKIQGDQIPLIQIMEGTKTKEGKIIDNGTGLSKKSCLEALRTLERIGLIKIQRGREVEGFRKTNFYKLVVRNSY